MNEKNTRKSIFLCIVDSSSKKDEVRIGYTMIENKEGAKGTFPDSFFDLKLEKIIVKKEEMMRICNELFLDLPIDCDILLMSSGGSFLSGSIINLQNILDERDQHAFVCPRTNVPSIFSFPFGDDEYENKERFSAWKNYAKEYLPENAVVPHPEPHCVMIKSKYIKNLGGFSEKCIDIRTALQDLSLRWNKYGYSTIMANHVYFESEARNFPLLNEKFHANKHLEYRVSVANYFSISQDPLDYFADILSGIINKKKIIFYLLQVKPLYNGTAEYSLSLLNSFSKLFGDRYEISALVPRDTYDFFKQSFPGGVNVIFEEDIASAGRFDIAFSVVQYFNVKHLPLIFALAPRRVDVILDAIAWRCMYLSNMGEAAVINSFSTELADGLLSISENSLKDVQSYLNMNVSADLLQSYTYLGSDFELLGSGDSDKDGKMVNKFEFLNEKYILIFGNSYKHKSTRETVMALRDLDIIKVVIGDNRFGYPVKNTDKFVFFPSGSIPATIMKKIYANAHLLVFPSQYEGFGLPIFKAIKNCKKIFVYNNAINQELGHAFVKNEGQIFFFNRFADLSAMISGHISEYSLQFTELPSWDKVAEQTEGFIDKALNQPIDAKKIRLRRYIAKLWPANPGSQIAEQEISIRMLWQMGRIYLRRKYVRYYQKGREFLFNE